MAESPPGRIIKGLQNFLTSAFVIWRAYCQLETADCSDA
jgi:hypothetical protein